VIRDIHHVGIAVRDRQAALALYRDALGLAVVKEGAAPARGASVSLLPVGLSYLEIVEPLGADSPFARFIAGRGEGLHHLAFQTDGIDAEVAALRAKNVPLQDREPRDGFTGRLSFLSEEAFDGALLEVVEPPDAAGDPPAAASAVKRIDHVVLLVPDLDSACDRLRDYFGLSPKRRLERGSRRFAFFRPGDVIAEVIGPAGGPGPPGSARIAGLAFEVTGIDALVESLKARGFPVGEPHPALQGGRIASVHAGGACGVPVAFIDFSPTA